MQIPDPAGVGQRLRAIRITRRAQVPSKQRDQWSLKGVGRRVGVHGSTVLRLERGDFRVSDLIEPLAELYGVSPGYILTGEGEDERRVRMERLVGKIGAMDSMSLALLETVVDQIIQGARGKGEME